MRIALSALTVLAIAMISTQVFAAPSENKDLKCVNSAVKASVMTNFKKFKAGTNSCGIKLLHAGEFKETYIACTSDETDPMEYIVVMKQGEKCKVDYIASTNEASTPTFDSEEGLLKSIECSIDYGDNKLVCK